jgi:hypothetical protein
MSPPYTIGWVHNLKEAPTTSDASSVIGMAVAFSAIAVLFTIFRLSVRWKTVGRLGLDDAAITAGAVCYSVVATKCGCDRTDAERQLLGIGYSAITIYQTRYGLGLDEHSFPLENAVPFSKVGVDVPIV